MVSTGIEALDAHIEGLTEGRYYLLCGSPGAGKTSAALQFLAAGLASGQTCAILTQDDPQDLLAQAEFLGYDFRTPAEEERLVVLQYRLDFRRNFGRTSNPERVFAELREHLGPELPARLVIDSAVPFVEGGRVSEDAQNAFLAFLDELPSTTYLVLPGDLSDQHYHQEFDRLISGSAGIFHFAVKEGQQRELTIQKLRQQMRSTEPLRFVIRPLMGIVESGMVRGVVDLPPEILNRVIVFAQGAECPDELMAALRERYEVVTIEDVASGFAELASGRYGALLMAISPRKTSGPFGLARQLRKLGNGAPIIFYSTGEGLRASTRAQGLKSGGDDFLTDEQGPQEWLERISVAIERGHRRAAGEAEDEAPIELQPTDANGAYVLMEERAFRNAVRSMMERSTHPFFALVLLRPSDLGRQEAWRILSSKLRVKEGDLGGHLRDGRIALYLHDVRRRHVNELMGRITDAHPGMGGIGPVEVFCYPADRAEVERWLGESGTESGVEMAAARP